MRIQREDRGPDPPPPPGKSQVIRISIEISIGTPPPPGRSCMRGSRNFGQWGPGQSDKKALTFFVFFCFFYFFSPQLIIQKSNGQFQ